MNNCSPELKKIDVQLNTLELFNLKGDFTDRHTKTQEFCRIVIW